MNENKYDQVIPLSEAMKVLSLGGRKTVKLIASAGIKPVRTWSGVGYRADDIYALKRSTW